MTGAKATMADFKTKSQNLHRKIHHLTKGDLRADNKAQGIPNRKPDCKPFSGSSRYDRTIINVAQLVPCLVLYN
jgi:hypothetical protein